MLTQRQVHSRGCRVLPPPLPDRTVIKALAHHPHTPRQLSLAKLRLDVRPGPEPVEVGAISFDFDEIVRRLAGPGSTPTSRGPGGPKEALVRMR